MKSGILMLLQSLLSLDPLSFSQRFHDSTLVIFMELICLSVSVHRYTFTFIHTCWFFSFMKINQCNTWWVKTCVSCNNFDTTGFKTGNVFLVKTSDAGVKRLLQFKEAAGTGNCQLDKACCLGNMIVGKPRQLTHQASGPVGVSGCPRLLVMVL